MDDIVERGELGAFVEVAGYRPGAFAAVAGTAFGVTAVCLLAAAATPGRSGLIPYGVSCAVLALGYGLRGWVAKGKPRVDVFEGGFRVTDRRDVVTWHRWQDMVVHAGAEYTFMDRDRRTIVSLGGYRGRYRQAPRYCQAITRAQLPYVIAEVERGGTVEFASLGVRSDVLVHGDVEVPWGELAPVSVTGGALRVVRKGVRTPIALIPMGQVLNRGVLFGAINHFYAKATS